MFDKLLFDLHDPQNLAISACIIGVLIFALVRVGIKRLALVYCALLLALLSVGDGILEIPAADILAHSKTGFIALVMLTVAIKGAASMVGFYECGRIQKFVLNCMFIAYSVLISVIGQYAIFEDGDLHKANTKAQITALQSERARLERIADDYASMRRYQKSTDERERIAAINAQLSGLQATDSVSTSTTLAKPAARLGTDADTLLFWLNLIRALVVMYAMIFVSHITSNLYHKINGTARDTAGQSRDGAGTGTGTRKKKWRFSLGKSAKSNVSDGEILNRLGDWVRKNHIGYVSKNTVQDCVKAWQKIGINNDRASRLAKQFRSGVA